MAIPITISAKAESWPISGRFTTARGSKISADVVVVAITDGERTGFGECLPYPRYAESPAATMQQIRHYAQQAPTLGCEALQEALPPGAARNALDCAMWDLLAKRAERPVWELAGLHEPEPVITAFTLSLDTPERMQASAEKNTMQPLLKVKLGGADADRDSERLRAIRRGAPAARLIVDANEGWSLEQLRQFAPVAAELGVEMIEQPLAASADHALVDFSSPVPIGADESSGADTNLIELATRYQIINIKLDKSGGLSHAIKLKYQAEQLGLEVMIGCMVATSLSMAPALLLAQTARFVDLDGPLLLTRDRQPGLVFADGYIAFPAGACWGSGS